jgi:hypothetical protein
MKIPYINTDFFLENTVLVLMTLNNLVYILRGLKGGIIGVQDIKFGPIALFSSTCQIAGLTIHMSGFLFDCSKS